MIRVYQFALRPPIENEPLARAQILAQHQGLSVSDVIRQYIRRAFAEAFSPKKKH